MRYLFGDEGGLAEDVALFCNLFVTNLQLQREFLRMRGVLKHAR